MSPRSRMLVAAVTTGGLFLLVQLGSLALVEPFVSAGYRAVEDPQDPTNTLTYIAAILIATGVILLILRLEAGRVLRGIVAAMSGMLALYMFSVLVPRVIVYGEFNVLAWGFAAALAIALYAYPEWYVIDAAGVIMGASGAGLFGISFGPLPAILLLGLLAVYDAISVYRTEHMLTLAEGVTDLKLPLLLVIPLSWSYSFLAAGPAGGGPGAAGAGPDADGSTLADDDREPDESVRSDQDEAGEHGPPDAFERDAFFVGLGDAVLPTVMVASAATFIAAPSLGVPGLALNLPAAAAMVGTLVGLSILLWAVAKGRPHAGLPLLNGGAIGGYLVGALASGIGLVQALGLGPYL